MDSFTIRRGNIEVEVSALGALKPVEVGGEVGAIIARGLLHYDKEIGKSVVEKQGKELVELAWSEERQAAVELRLEALLSAMFDGVKIKAAKRVKSIKVDVDVVVADALRAAGLDEAAVEAACKAQGRKYAAPVVKAPVAPAEEQG